MPLALRLVVLLAAAQTSPKLDLPRPSPNAVVKQTVGFTEVTVAYSSPAVKGRRVFGEVVPFDEVWRAGANECTKLTVSTPVAVEGKPLAAGTYCLFYLPTRAGWTFILNRDTKLWGAVGYKAGDDVLRVPATVTTIPARERLAFSILDFDDAGGTLALEWATVRAGVKLTLDARSKVLAQLRSLKSDDWRSYDKGARYLLGARSEPALALELANRSIQIKEGWLNVWTKAQLLRAAGRTQEALALARRAQDLGGKSPEFFEADEVAKALATWKG